MPPSPPPEPTATRHGRLRQALFLDRDGVLNDEVNYLHDPRDLVMIPGVGAVIAACNRRGVVVVTVTNQAGIGRGLYDVDAFWNVNRAITRELARDGATIDGWYFCPHHPDAGCACRKPSPTMLHIASSQLGIDLARSVMVGDKITDLEAARAAGVRAVLVRTGYGREDERRLLAAGRTELFDACHDSLADARDVIWSLLGLDAGPGGARKTRADVS